MVGAPCFEKSDELVQPPLVFAQSKSKSPAEIDVFPQIFSQISHRAPPGHGWARFRNARKSTLA
jgi:hypothetical protein